MRYIKTQWLHGEDDLSNVYYSSFDERGEVQRIEQFALGKILYADHTNQEGIGKTSQAEFDPLWQNPKPKISTANLKILEIIK